jgi:Leucine-rich repeat (LRR) protein
MKTSIISPHQTFSNAPDLATLALDFDGNVGVRYLPVKVHENFPNLLVLYAASCKISEISKANFEQLFKLKYLNLFDNQIETIPDGTFDDLIVLVSISLSEFH